MAEVEVSIDGGIATITLRRPPVNTLSRTMIVQLIDELSRIDATDAIRVSILTGDGRWRRHRCVLQYSGRQRDGCLWSAGNQCRHVGRRPPCDAAARHSTVNRMILTGHQLDARELYHRRAVEACLPADELMPYARAIADEIASKDSIAIRLARQSLAQIEDTGVLEGYRHEMALAHDLGKTPGARAAMRGFLERGSNKRF